MCVSRCQIRIGSVAGTVSTRTDEPPANTRMSANAGRYFATESVSATAPRSTSCISATDVIGLVME